MNTTGIAHIAQLRRAGWTDAHIAKWTKTGRVRAIGRWRVTAEAAPRAVSLLERGLRPTCVDAARLAGLWAPLVPGLHGYAPRRGPRAFGAPVIDKTNATPPASLPVVLHSPVLRAWPDDELLPALPLLLEHAGRCLDAPQAAVIFESAMNKGLISRADVQDVLARLPGHRGRDLARVNPRSESGTETIVRWWFESLRIPVRAQVRIPDVGWVDLLVGRSWVIECDSRRFHGTEDAFHRDRRRDLLLRAMGYTVTRLTWEQVMLSWGATQESLLAVVRRRDHRRDPA